MNSESKINFGWLTNSTFNPPRLSSIFYSYSSSPSLRTLINSNNYHGFLNLWRFCRYGFYVLVFSAVPLLYLSVSFLLALLSPVSAVSWYPNTMQLYLLCLSCLFFQSIKYQTNVELVVLEFSPIMAVKLSCISPYKNLVLLILSLRNWGMTFYLHHHYQHLQVNQFSITQIDHTNKYFQTVQNEITLYR